MDDSHPYCAAEGCFVHIYCAQCTQCHKLFCSEHIPVGAHKCVSGGSASASGGGGDAHAAATSSPSAAAAGAGQGQQQHQHRPSIGRPNSVDSSGGRVRSREGVGAAGGGPDTGGELASPEFVKRLSSSSPLSLSGLLRRSSSLMGGRGGVSLSGPGGASPSPSGLHPPSFSRPPSGLMGNGGGGGGLSMGLPRGLSSMFASPSHGALGGHMGGADAMGDYLLRTGSGSLPLQPPEAMGLLLHQPSRDSQSQSIPRHSSPLPRGLPRIPSRDSPLSSPLTRRQHVELLGAAATGASSPLHMAGAPMQHSAVKLTRQRSRELNALGATQDLFANVLRGDEQMLQQHERDSIEGAPHAAQQQTTGRKRKALHTSPPPQQQQQQQQQQEESSATPPSPPPPPPPPPPPVVHQPTPRTNHAKQLAPQQHPVVSQPMPDPWQLSAAVAAAHATAHAAAHAVAQAPPPLVPAVAFPSPLSMGAGLSGEVRSMIDAYEREYARMEQVRRLLTHWVPAAKPQQSPLSTPSESAPSGAPSPVPASVESADDLVLQYQRAVHVFKRDVLDRDAPSASPDSTDMSTVLPLGERRMRMCEAIVAIAIRQTERTTGDPIAAATAAAATSAGGWGAATQSPLPSAAVAAAVAAAAAAAAAPASSSSSSPSPRLPPLVHPLLSPLSRCLCLLADCLLLNELELSVMSLYLDRLCGAWPLRLERSHTGSAGLQTEMHNMRVLHYVAYMSKLSLSDPLLSASPHDPLLTYLTALYPDFAYAFSAWLHEKGATQISTPPVQLNQRFYAITTFNNNDNL